ncbi:MAG: holo-ACP synthase [Chloroflexi bacterium]|nr:holo-ACP synthase [Chloroflexota bacterium]
MSTGGRRDVGPPGIVVGVDLVEIERVRDTLARHGERFLGRVFTEQERGYCGTRAGSLAARFAAKEAVGKALGTGFFPLPWRDVEIVCDEWGKPHVVLHGLARKRARELGIGTLELSLSHSRGSAVAVVVGMIVSGDTPEPPA